MSTQRSDPRPLITVYFMLIFLILLVVYGVTKITNDYERRIQQLEQKK